MDDASKKPEDPLSEYRKLLLTLEQQGQSEYDKAVLTLSGGALGISMTFLKDVVIKQGVEGGIWIIVAWVFWAVGICSTLYSFYASAAAMRHAIKQTDDGTIHTEKPGGLLDNITKILNGAAGILFVLGVVAVCIFVGVNIP